MTHYYLEPQSISCVGFAGKYTNCYQWLIKSFRSTKTLLSKCNLVMTENVITKWQTVHCGWLNIRPNWNVIETAEKGLTDAGQASAKEVWHSTLEEGPPSLIASPGESMWLPASSGLVIVVLISLKRHWEQKPTYPWLAFLPFILHPRNPNSLSPCWHQCPPLRDINPSNPP